MRNVANHHVEHLYWEQEVRLTVWAYVNSVFLRGSDTAPFNRALARLLAQVPDDATFEAAYALGGGVAIQELVICVLPRGKAWLSRE
jgi:hypothetical protein